jgi:hypothetical protein
MYILKGWNNRASTWNWFVCFLFYPLTLWRRTAYVMSPLNSWMAIKEATNSVSKIGAILFTPNRFSAVGCYVSGLWKVMLCFRTQNVPPSPPKPPHKHRYKRRLSNCAFFSSWLAWFWHWVLWLPLAVEFTVCWNIDTGLWNKPSFFTIKVVGGVLYPYNSEKTNAKKSEVSTKIDVCSYSMAHRHASCSVGVVV